MKSTKNNGWDDPDSSITPRYDAENNLISVRGVYIHNGIKMPFSLKRQQQGKCNCAYRGSIRINSPENGYVLTCGKGKKPCKFELNTDKSTLSKIREYIKRRAEALYLKYSEEINRGFQRAGECSAVTPETITPALACRMYVDRFISARYPIKKEACDDEKTEEMKRQEEEEQQKKIKKNTERKGMLIRFFGGLIDEPMAKFSARQIERHIKNNNFGQDVVRLAEAFWEFVLDRQYAVGLNPFPRKAETRKSAETLQREAMRASSLSREAEHALYDELMKATSGLDGGVALLASGFTATEVCGVTWKDVFSIQSVRIL